jgi:outer membrane receptor protein involved in Fe transport
VTKWTSTVSNKLLVDLGFSTQIFQLLGVYQPEVAGPSATNPYGDIAKRDLIRGKTWNAAPSGETYLDAFTYNLNASATYVTGSHSFKVGQQFARARNGSGTTKQNGDLVQQYRDGVPDSVVVYNTPTNVQTNLDYKLGLYVQDSWRVNRRLTFNPGLRYDRHRNSIPPQSAAAGRFVPERNFAAIPNIISWNDVSPRLGAVYDLSGDGKTAIKASLGKYPQFEIANTAARYNPMTLTGGTGSAVTDTRTWTDRNGNDIAEENELGPSTNASTPYS